MANNNFTTEQLAAAKEAKSPEELVATAKDAGIDVTPEQAAAFLGTGTVELADEELENVAGGGCGEQDKWRTLAAADGRRVKVTLGRGERDKCMSCGTLASVYANYTAKVTVAQDCGLERYNYYAVDNFFDCKCYACGATFHEISNDPRYNN